MTKHTYCYKGPAFRLDEDNRLYYLATDANGDPVQYEMYCEAKSPEHAGNLFKWRLAHMYRKRSDPIKLLKNCLYVKKNE